MKLREELKDRLSSWRTGELAEVVDDKILLTRDNERLQRDVLHLRQDRDRQAREASTFKSLYEAAELTIKAQKEDLARVEGRLAAAHAELLANGLIG